MGNASVGIGNAVGGGGNAGDWCRCSTRSNRPACWDLLISGSVNIDTESIEVLSRLNMNGFIGNITDDFEDKIEIASEGLSELFETFDKINPTSVLSIEKASTGISRLLLGMSSYLPKIKTSDSRNLAKVADGLEDFFEAIDDMDLNKVKEIPLVGTAIGSLSTGLQTVNLIPEEAGSILDKLGEGIEEFLSEIEDVDQYICQTWNRGFVISVYFKDCHITTSKYAKCW